MAIASSSRSSHTSTAQLEHLISVIDLTAQTLRWLATSADAIKTAIEEVVRFRKSLSRGHTALDFSEFLTALEHKDQELSEYLSSAKIERFELGRLWIRAEEKYGDSLFLFRKNAIVQQLARYYGATFKVRVISDQR